MHDQPNFPLHLVFWRNGFHDAYCMELIRNFFLIDPVPADPRMSEEIFGGADGPQACLWGGKGRGNS